MEDSIGGGLIFEIEKGFWSNLSLPYRRSVSVLTWLRIAQSLIWRAVAAIRKCGLVQGSKTRQDQARLTKTALNPVLSRLGLVFIKPLDKRSSRLALPRRISSCCCSM